ncbi:S41 family peptidase [Mucilaginibacter glaciei]|uniref:S41 family peptidase n=1 Tax=Mucilaginibacter glaciei TaxID=2772109 RepID=A0A926S4G0_9SPHI|nr:S41 family peptidase [Mucilaginibacter glaciei]MBD1391751.1 S41 family peptidase [Mucilaginibacter glaciei]
MKIKLLLLTFFIPLFSFSQQSLTSADSARKVIDTALAYAKKSSIYRDKVDWKNLTDSVKIKSKDAANINAAMPAVALMYKMLGDFHGMALYQGKTYKWATTKVKADKEKYKELFAKFKRGNTQIETRVLENGYGYLLIPGNNPTRQGEIQLIAAQIQDSLTKLNPAKLKGVIIDLRLNTGGNMWPMILGVGNLVSAGKLGTFVYPVASMNESWSVKDTSIYSDANKVCSVKAFSKVNPKIKIVVLTSPYTASSGEATAITFKGQKNARIVGDVSAGYTIANEGFSCYGVQFIMATSVEADRTGKVYYENVPPDQEVIAGDNFNDFSKDAKIIAALRWMKGK